MNPIFDISLASVAVDQDRASWVQLLPAEGPIRARDGREWVLNNAAAVVAASLAKAGTTPLPVDYDHQLMNAEKNGQPAPAAGWITELEARPSGVWGRIEWTARAAAHLRQREYRFISPVFAALKATGEIIRLDNAGLTNQPALEMTALASIQRKNMEEIETELRSLLNVAADAPADTILEAVRTLATSASSASVRPDQYVPIALFEKVTAELQRNSQGVSLEAATLAVDRECEAGRLIPAMREWAIELCQQNRPAFDGFIQRTGGGLQAVFATPGPRGRVPGAPTMTAAQSEISRNLGLTDEDVAKYGN